MWTKTDIQRAVIHTLRPLGPLGEPAEREAEEASWAATAAGDPSAITALVELARDLPSEGELAECVSASDFQAQLTHILGLVGLAAPEAVVDPIGELVDVPGARAMVIEVLGEIGHPDGLRWLAPLVDAELSDDEAVWLASSLGEIGTVNAAPLLERLRAHTPPERSSVLREIEIAEHALARRAGAP